jgi:hypothetical protein
MISNMQKQPSRLRSIASMPRKKLGLKRHTCTLDEATEKDALEYYGALAKRFGSSLPWGAVLASLVKRGLEAVRAEEKAAAPPKKKAAKP